MSCYPYQCNATTYATMFYLFFSIKHDIYQLDRKKYIEHFTIYISCNGTMDVVLGTRLSILVVMWYYLAHAMLLLMLLYCDVFYLFFSI